MLDGLKLSRDETAVVAIGITSEGYKHVLDFDLGSTENAEVCRNLMRRPEQTGVPLPASFVCGSRWQRCLADGGERVLSRQRDSALSGSQRT